MRRIVDEDDDNDDGGDDGSLGRISLAKGIGERDTTLELNGRAGGLRSLCRLRDVRSAPPDSGHSSELNVVRGQNGYLYEWGVRHRERERRYFESLAQRDCETLWCTSPCAVHYGICRATPSVWKSFENGVLGVENGSFVYFGNI